MEVVECIYRRLFNVDPSAAEQLDPVTITSQILESYDKVYLQLFQTNQICNSFSSLQCGCRDSAHSLLLWLSIIRKVFSVPVETGVQISAPTEVSIQISAGLDPVPISAQASLVVGDEDLKAVQQTLLRTTTFVPALVSTGTQKPVHCSHITLVFFLRETV